VRRLSRIVSKTSLLSDIQANVTSLFTPTTLKLVRLYTVMAATGKLRKISMAVAFWRFCISSNSMTSSRRSRVMRDSPVIAFPPDNYTQYVTLQCVPGMLRDPYVKMQLLFSYLAYNLRETQVGVGSRRVYGVFRSGGAGGRREIRPNRHSDSVGRSSMFLSSKDLRLITRSVFRRR